MHVDALGAFLLWTNSIVPVVVIREASARPAENGDSQLAKIFHSLLSVAINVGDGRIGSDPQAPVNATADVLGKMSVKVRANNADLRVGQNIYASRSIGLPENASRDKGSERQSQSVGSELSP
jgi:hypothetical protein